MKRQATTVHQSGQHVVIAGLYEVIGVLHDPKAKEEDRHERSRRFLSVGEFFPNYQGRAVGWHLLTSDPRAGSLVNGKESWI